MTDVWRELYNNATERGQHKAQAIGYMEATLKSILAMAEDCDNLNARKNSIVRQCKEALEFSQNKWDEADAIGKEESADDETNA